jgi:hypothetical protein
MQHGDLRGQTSARRLMMMLLTLLAFVILSAGYSYSLMDQLAK